MCNPKLGCPRISDVVSSLFGVSGPPACHSVESVDLSTLFFNLEKALGHMALEHWGSTSTMNCPGNDDPSC